LAAGPKEDVFCGIWRGLERAYVAYKDDRVMVIMDLYPLERGQALIVPREHFQYLLRDAWRLMEHFYLVSSATARALKELYKPKAVVMLARGLRSPITT